MNKRNQLTKKMEVVREPVATYELARSGTGIINDTEQRWWNSRSESYRKYVIDRVDEALSGSSAGKYSNKKDFSQWLYEKVNVQHQ